MLQKEVVERMSSGPGNKDYGRLSIMCQYYCRVDLLFVVSPHSFKPQPKVDSAIVRLKPHKSLPYPAKNIRMFDTIVKAAFQQRRKTLRNALRAHVEDMELLRELGIDASLRPENLSLEDYVNIANRLSELDNT